MRTARLLAMLAAWAGWLQSEPVEVRTYDYASTPQEVVRNLLEVTRSALQDAGVPLTVEDCTAGCEPAGQRTTIIVRVRPGFRGAALGAARIGPERGGYIDVLTGAANQFSVRNAPDNSVLGYIVAHEIGHLLLGSMRHAAAGVMKARWDNADSWLMARGLLRFSPQEARRMRERLAAAEPMESARAR